MGGGEATATVTVTAAAAAPAAAAAAAAAARERQRQGLRLGLGSEWARGRVRSCCCLACRSPPVANSPHHRQAKWGWGPTRSRPPRAMLGGGPRLWAGGGAAPAPPETPSARGCASPSRNSVSLRSPLAESLLWFRRSAGLRWNRRRDA